MTPEHAQLRCGHATASEFASILAKGQGKMRAAYLRRIVAEMLTGKPCGNGFRNPDTDRGEAQEPWARMAYEAATGNWVDRPDPEFIKHPKLAAGCSPDGLVGDDGGAEIKSVIPTVQLDTILAGGYPSEHRAQIQGSLWITGRKYWDFVSYSPDLPGKLCLYIFRVERDEEYISKLAAEVACFVREAEQMRDLLLGRDSLEERLQESLKVA